MGLFSRALDWDIRRRQRDMETLQERRGRIASLIKEVKQVTAYPEGSSGTTQMRVEVNRKNVLNLLNQIGGDPNAVSKVKDFVTHSFMRRGWTKEAASGKFDKWFQDWQQGAGQDIDSDYGED